MKYLNVSIHDITASKLVLVEGLVEFLKSLKIEKISLLIVPKHHDVESVSEIIDRIKPLTEKNEIVLHGYTHLGKRFSKLSYKNIFTDNEGEFVSFEDTEERIIKGIEVLKENGLMPEGFIPPAWLMRKDDFKVLKKFGFRFTTDRRYVYDLQTGKKYFSPVITFSSRRFIEGLSLSYVFISKKFIKNFSLLRIALHPNDINSSRKTNLIGEIIRTNRQRKVVSLKEFLDEHNLIKNK